MSINVSLKSKKQWQAIRSPFRAGLLEVVAASGGSTVKQLADAFGVDAPQVHYHVKLLHEAGLVVRSRRTSVRGQVYSANFSKLLLEVDLNSKVQSERAAKFVDRWLTASKRCIVDGEARGVDAHVLLEWENLTAAEARRIEGHFKSVDAVLKAAAKRRRKAGTLNAQSATHHVAFAVMPLSEPEPVNPRVDLKPRRG